MQVITIKELSEFLKVKEKTLYQWAEFGQIPCLKLNGVLRFDLDDIQKWILTCKRSPSERYNSIAQTAGVRSPRKGVKVCGNLPTR
jgi:excisionase family DNA binding protein